MKEQVNGVFTAGDETQPKTTLKKRWKRGLSVALTAALLASMSTTSVFASAGNPSAVSVTAQDDQKGTGAESTAVTVNDKNLKKALCRALEKTYSADVQITQSEMESLTELDASNYGITDLTGLETAVNMEKLNLSGNLLDDEKRYERGSTSTGFCSTLLKLKSMAKLKELNLSNCRLGDNYCAGGRPGMKTPAIPGNLSSVLEELKSLEVLDLSDNGFVGSMRFYVGVLGYDNLTSLDLSGNRINSLEGVQSRYLTNLKTLDLSDNYVFWDERDGSWHSPFMADGNTVKTDYQNQKNLAGLYCVYYAGNGLATNSYSNFSTAVVDQETKVVDLGSVCGGTVTVSLGGFANTNSTKATIDGQKATVTSLTDISTMGDANYQFTFSGLKDGTYEYPVEVMHMGEDKETYTLRFRMTSVPADDREDSAGIRDIRLQNAVCSKLGKDISSYVVTKDDMASLTTLSISNAENLEGLQYAVNLTSLTLTSKKLTEIPDLSGMTKLKTLSVFSNALEHVVDVSALTSLTSLSISAANGKELPDIGNLTNLKSLAVVYCDSDVLPGGIENCQKLTSFSYSYCSGTHSFPENIVTAAGTLSYSIQYPMEDAVFPLSGAAENKNVTELKVTVNNMEESKNVKVTGIDKNLTALTSLTVNSGMTDGMLPDTLGEAPALKTLSLKGPFSTLPQSIGQSESITTVSVTDAQQLPEVVGQISSMTKLTVNSCETVSAQIDYSKTALTTLSITQSGLMEVPSGELLPASLATLTLTGNKIQKMSGNGYEKLKNLKTLKMGDNRISAFPTALKQLSNLETLDLGLNYYGSIPQDAFDGMDYLKKVTLGSMLPLRKNADGSYYVDEKYEGTAAAVAKAEEITAKNNGSVTLEDFQASYFGQQYASLAYLDSSEGVLSDYLVEDRDVFAVLDPEVTSIKLKPVALFEDTVIEYDGKTYKSGEEIPIEHLENGANEITLKVSNDFVNHANADTATTYTVTLYCGSMISADELEEGHTYRIDYKLYKSGLSTLSMSSTYFLPYATVRYKNGKYEVRITTIKSSYISDLDYYDLDGLRQDAEAINVDTAADTAEYRMYTDSLTERMSISPFVVPMGYYPICDVVFSTNNIVDITDQMPSVDLADINGVVNKAQEIAAKRNVYTDESYQVFTDALARAQKAAADSTSTQDEIDAAKDALNAAIAGLTVDESKLADKTALKTAIDEAAAIQKGSHTDTAWNALQEAIADARNVYDTLEASQSEVDSAAKNLNLAATLFNNSGTASTLDKNNLQDGVYSVYADMIHANRQQTSMADNAINHTVKLEVVNGEYYVTLDFKGMNITLGDQTFFGYLSKLSYYDEGYTYSAETNMPEGKLTAAEVLSTQKNADGTDVIDSYNDADSLYPDLMKIKLVKSAVADADGYVPLQVFVPVMEAIAEGSGTQDVLMKVDWSSLKTVSMADTPSDSSPGNGNAGGQTAEAAIQKGQTLEQGALRYQVTATGKDAAVAVTGVVKKEAAVVIPASITVQGVTFKVTSIAAKAFQNNKKVTSVKVGSSVKSIGNKAFYKCTKLKKLTLGKNVKTIGAQAFAKCTKLTKAAIPSKVTKIGKQAFCGDKKLKTVTIKSKKIKTVGKKAFAGVHKKATVKLSKLSKKQKRSLKRKLTKSGIAKTVKIK